MQGDNRAFDGSDGGSGSGSDSSGSGSGSGSKQEVVLHYFLKALLQAGEWEAALGALAQHPHDTGHMIVATKALFRAGQWRLCVGMLQAAMEKHQGGVGGPPEDACRIAEADAAILHLAEIASQACAQSGRWETSVQLCGSIIQPVMEKHFWDLGNRQRNAVAVMHVLSVVPFHAQTVRRSLHAFADALRTAQSHNNSGGLGSPPPHQSGQRSSAVQANIQLTEIMRRASGGGRARNAWVEGIQVFQGMAHPDAVSANVLARILGRQHRTAELMACMLSPTAPRPNENTGKALAEAAYDCRSWMAGLQVLCGASTCTQSPLLSNLAPLSASAAIPALMALRQNKGKWAQSLEWWERQPPRGDPHSLRGNQKVSSYVAHHVACSVHPHMAPPLTFKTSTHAIPHLNWVWQRALSIIASTADVHPPRAALFGLQALHLACCWVKAVELYQAHHGGLLGAIGPRELESMQDVIAGDNARRWVPGDVVIALRRFMRRA